MVACSKWIARGLRRDAPAGSIKTIDKYNNITFEDFNPKKHDWDHMPERNRIVIGKGR